MKTTKNSTNNTEEMTKIKRNTIRINEPLIF